MTDTFNELDHPARLLMGPGPINVHPRVLRAMSVQLLGQFDPEFTGYMNEVMALYRGVFQTQNRWTFTIDGTSRAGIEAALVSTLQPGDDVVVVNAGRFGLLLAEIAERCDAKVTFVEASWAPWSIRRRSRMRSSASSRAWSPASTATPRPPWPSRWERSARSAARTGR